MSRMGLSIVFRAKTSLQKRTRDDPIGSEFLGQLVVECDGLEPLDGIEIEMSIKFAECPIDLGRGSPQPGLILIVNTDHGGPFI